jgi:D-cysteine desulfhydrase family pyridoxal phosphate-dependent enzyme
MRTEDLNAKLAAWPRLRLGVYPTPLEPLSRLSDQLRGSQIWIKRDDSIGLGIGGNKARKLDYLLADALAQGKRMVVTFGGLQSNHVRLTASTCASLGLETHIIHYARKPKEAKGNQLLNRLFGAKIHYVPFGGGSDGTMRVQTTSRLTRMLAAVLIGPRFYFIPVGGHSPIGCLGYVEAALEIHRQVLDSGLLDQPVTVVTAAGTGGTLAGLLAGFHLLHSPIQTLGIDIGRLWKAFPESVANLAGELCALLGEPQAFQADSVPLLEDRYVGPKYAAKMPEAVEAIRLLAQTQGIILDPVYTGKAFAGLIDLIHRGHFQKGENVIFLHSGGYPAIFAFEEYFS